MITANLRYKGTDGSAKAFAEEMITSDFGEEIGVKKSSAQITALYQPEDLIGTQVICCVNLTPIHIGSVKSEVRTLFCGGINDAGEAEQHRDKLEEAYEFGRHLK